MFAEISKLIFILLFLVFAAAIQVVWASGKCKFHRDQDRQGKLKIQLVRNDKFNHNLG